MMISKQHFPFIILKNSEHCNMLQVIAADFLIISGILINWKLSKNLVILNVSQNY